MNLHLPGLLKERMRSGRDRFRVRVAGDKTRRIPLHVDPEHPDFLEHYRAARSGVELQATAPAIERHVHRSVAWLVAAFCDHMAAQEAAAQLHPATVKQRRYFLDKLTVEYGTMHMAMPGHAVLAMRDDMAPTPGAADNFVKAVRALYAWALARQLVAKNPASGIGKIGRGTGAVPWSIDDLRQYRKAHPFGTTAHLALSLFMFTACRVSDVVNLGRDHERIIQGVAHLDWRPAKKGSAQVTVPILPPLARALDARTIIGPTYLLTAHGKPFSSSAAFGNKFRDWTARAKLHNRSPHGIRKAAGELLALEGATQYHIMAVHGHTQAKTSEGYTSGVNRQKLASEAMRMLSGMDW